MLVFTAAAEGGQLEHKAEKKRKIDIVNTVVIR
jgi:hypothetical protein